MRSSTARLLDNISFLMRQLPHFAVSSLLLFCPQQLFLARASPRSSVCLVTFQKTSALVFVFIAETSVKYDEYFSARACWREPLSARGVGDNKPTLLLSGVFPPQLRLLDVSASLLLCFHGTEWLFSDSPNLSGARWMSKAFLVDVNKFLVYRFMSGYPGLNNRRTDASFSGAGR